MMLMYISNAITQVSRWYIVCDQGGREVCIGRDTGVLQAQQLFVLCPPAELLWVSDDIVYVDALLLNMLHALLIVQCAFDAVIAVGVVVVCCGSILLLCEVLVAMMKMMMLLLSLLQLEIQL
jgi:hypothetical protein